MQLKKTCRRSKSVSQYNFRVTSVGLETHPNVDIFIYSFVCSVVFNARVSAFLIREVWELYISFIWALLLATILVNFQLFSSQCIVQTFIHNSVNLVLNLVFVVFLFKIEKYIENWVNLETCRTSTKNEVFNHLTRNYIRKKKRLRFLKKAASVIIFPLNVVTTDNK